jgi:hypothetical protein
MLFPEPDSTRVPWMPEISRFLGIVIRMYYNDHSPPHFHAEYGDFEISVEIETGIVTGRFPPRALKIVREWADQNRERLADNWNSAQNRLPLKRIKPLE